MSRLLATMIAPVTALQKLQAEKLLQMLRQKYLEQQCQAAVQRSTTESFVKDRTAVFTTGSNESVKRDSCTTTMGYWPTLGKWPITFGRWPTQESAMGEARYPWWDLNRHRSL